MPTVINTNLASLYAQNNLSNAQNNLALSVQRLSSGLRINSAKDDAAGLAIAQNMQGQINGIDQSRKNLNDAINLTQVAESSLGTIHEMLLRIKQLSVQGYDGSLSASQRTQIVDEINELNTEINNTATRTKFNGNNLIAAQFGVDYATSTMKLGEAVTANASVSKISSTSGAIAGTYTLSQAAAGTTLTMTRGTTTQSLTVSGVTAGSSYELDFSTHGVKISYQVSATADATNLAAALIAAGNVVVSGTAPSDLLFQGGSDTGVENLITYDAINVRTIASEVGSNEAMTDMGTTIGTLNGYTSTTVQADWATQFSALDTRVNAAINYISERRSEMGALQNRVNYVMQNLESQSTNMKSSKSSILDTDFAAETARLTKGQIMQQAATAMLAQANQMPNVVLSLLK
jgi:flagellin